MLCKAILEVLQIGVFGVDIKVDSAQGEVLIYAVVDLT